MKLSTIEYIGARPRRKKKKKGLVSILCILAIGTVGVVTTVKFGTTQLFAKDATENKRLSPSEVISNKVPGESVQNHFLETAIQRTTQNVSYDPAYYSIDYPMGDIPSKKGVCTDVIIRTYRSIGIDLQQKVHEDMQKNFDSYPKTWGLTSTDTNIDHRRVPNLRHFFGRNGKSLTISNLSTDYQYGDIVTWKLSHGASHIGIVVPSPFENDSSPWIVHNVGAGPKWDNCLFDYEITGHYRYKLD